MQTLQTDLRRPGRSPRLQRLYHGAKTATSRRFHTIAMVIVFFEGHPADTLEVLPVPGNFFPHRSVGRRAETLLETPGAVALQGPGAVARRHRPVVGFPVARQEVRLLSLRHPAVLVAPVARALADAALPGQMLADAIGHVPGRLTDVDDVLLGVGELVHAGHGV